MAIRAFRKNMKPVIWVLTVVFILSLVIAYAPNLMALFKADGSVAMEVNGEKIKVIDIQRKMNQMENTFQRNYNQTADRENIKFLAVQDSIENSLLIKEAENKGIKVEDSEVDKFYEDQFKGATKEQIKAFLTNMGYTKSTFKDEIKTNLEVEKLLNVEVKPEEVKKYYNENASNQFLGKSFDSVKENIVRMLTLEKQLRKRDEIVAKLRATMKIEDLNDEFKNDMDSVVLNYKGEKVTKLDLYRTILNLNPISFKQKISRTQEDEVLNSFKQQIDLLKLIEKQGIKIDNNLPLNAKVTLAYTALVDKYKNEVVINDTALKQFYEKNKEIYKIPATVKINMVDMNMELTQTDKEKLKKEAEGILNEAKTVGMEQTMKKYRASKDIVVESLPIAKAGEMVKEFEDACKTGKIGEVYPTLVETQFGYHIIFVVNRDEKAGTFTANHILVPTTKVTPEKLKEVEATAKNLVNELNSKKITLDALEKQKSLVSKVVRDKEFTSGGPKDKVMEQLFGYQLNVWNELKAGGKVMLVQKLSQTDEKMPTFEEVKDQVIEDYKNNQMFDKITKFMMEAKQQIDSTQQPVVPKKK